MMLTIKEQTIVLAAREDEEDEETTEAPSAGERSNPSLNPQASSSSSSSSPSSCSARSSPEHLLPETPQNNPPTLENPSAVSSPSQSDPPLSSSPPPPPAVVQREQVSLVLSVEEEEDLHLKSLLSPNKEEDEDSDYNGLTTVSMEHDDKDDNHSKNRINPASGIHPLQHNNFNPTCSDQPAQESSGVGEQIIELRFLVRRREAGALIGKSGSNIKRLREAFRSSMFSIPDTGNGPERVVCVATNEKSIQPILNEITQLLVEKSPENDEQIELKLLIHSSQAGSIIGLGGQSIKKLRNDSRAAIKIYELCCPFSNERVCAIKARPPVVVNAIKLIQSILNENPIKGTIKPYDALHFDLMLAEKYGGFLPDELGNQLDSVNQHSHYKWRSMGGPYATRQYHEIGNYQTKHYPAWRPEFPYEQHPLLEMSEGFACHLDLHHHQQQQAMQQSMTAQIPTVSQLNVSTSISPSTSPTQLHLQYQQQQQRNKHESTFVDRCDQFDSKTTSKSPSLSSCAFANFPAASSYPQQQLHSFRYHPYAPPSPVTGSHAACARSTPLRHHHQRYPHNNSAYPPPLAPPGAARLLYGPGSIQHHRGHCIRMPATLSGLQPAVRCRHVKPCFCMFMPIMPQAAEVQTQHPLTAVATDQATVAQIPHLAKNFTYSNSRNSASGYNSNNNNIGATKKS